MKNDNGDDDGDDQKTTESCALNHLKANNHLNADEDNYDDHDEDGKASSGSSEGNLWPKAAQSSGSSKISYESSGYVSFLASLGRIIASILIEGRIPALITSVVNAEQPSETPKFNTVFVRALRFI